MDKPSRRPDWLGGVVGILTFLLGVGLLVLTFQQANAMFSVDPAKALQVKQGAQVDLMKTGESFVGVVGRILFLLVMSVVGSVIANRGIKLYAESRISHPPSPGSPSSKAKESVSGRPANEPTA
jgi:hypothetical protein